MTRKNSVHKTSYARYVWLALFAILLFTLTFFAAQWSGDRNGRLDAARDIEEKGNVTAGPDSLI